jgi:hypothetical protein
MYILVSAVEPKAGSIVVELVLVDRRQPGISPFMFSVAGTAGLVFKAAMQAHLGCDISGNLLVAVQAQPNLRPLVETDMAPGAFVLVFRVPCYHLAWHQGVLEGRLPRCCYREEYRQHQQQVPHERLNTCERR